MKGKTIKGKTSEKPLKSLYQMEGRTDSKLQKDVETLLLININGDIPHSWYFQYIPLDRHVEF